MTVYIGSNAYYRTKDGRWFYLNYRREPYFLDPDDVVDADTIATLDRKAAAGMTTSTFTPAIAALVADAVAADYTVTQENGSRLTIGKGQGRRFYGVTVFLTERGGFGGAIRADVDLSLALNIPSIKAVRLVLYLDRKAAQ